VGSNVATTNSTDAPELSSAVSMWHAFLLRKATQKVSGMTEAVLSPHGLSMRHFGVLSAVQAEPGLNQRVLGEGLRIDRSTVVALADDLERAGLLERRRGADRRTFSLHLTPHGVERLRAFKELVAGVHAEFLAPLSAAEQAMLRDLLFKIAAP
jgi:DNA-binding MarR family transcriptional regulator